MDTPGLPSLLVIKNSANIKDFLELSFIMGAAEVVSKL